MQQVWYVAYGSNLALDRFRCYLSGGRPAGGMRDYPGCRDPREPERVASLEVPGGLVFAGESRVWGGGMAFYDTKAAGRVACRAYLVTAEQLGDIAAQEMRREPGGEFARDLAGLLPDVDLIHAMGPGRYETIARLGSEDGIPMFTVTHGEVADLDLAAPTAAYVRWIAAGLREAHGWDGEQVAAYLSEASGVAEAWSVAELALVARG
ncbi:hypothetical protein GCM10009789_46880 [Kribbella sancticallisti]|uniref:Histone deacetylase n=1 Tax=Kribbella sancticallisti TaxID=460087 RepID=A0ABN2DVH3_9ACTN